MRSKCLNKFLKGINGTYPQTIEPSHRYRTKIGWEYLAQQGLILGVYNHPLIEVVDMLHRVCSTIVHSECGLSELPRKSLSLNPGVKGDLKIWLSALLIASFSMPPKDEFLFLHSWL